MIAIIENIITNNLKMENKMTKKIKTTDLDKMTPAQSRVAIAEDVIASLLAKRFKATTGTFINSPSATAKGIV